MNAHDGKLRADIQALRGFAVLSVLLYHAKFEFVPAGYLGVDVFFVVSGFLITTLIKNAAERADFSFFEFYFRRAKRLLPAAYVTLLATALAAPWFLAATEREELRAQFLGALSFTANIVLAMKSGYFAGSAELKPFLHMWSLSVEEQYYFFLPLLFVFVPKRLWFAGICLTLAVSGAACVLLASRDSTFFLLTTRAWELMIGSLGAFAALSKFPWIRRLAWPALVALIVLVCFKFTAQHPGLEALLICVATLILILARASFLSGGWSVTAMSKLGDISYSLYLVHWPVFAFYNNAWVAEAGAKQPLAMRALLAAASIAVAFMLHRLVEERFRRMEVVNKRRAVVFGMACTVALAGLAIWSTQVADGAKQASNARRPNYGLAASCDYAGRFEPKAECSTAPQPEVLVWGDSYAMHLVTALTVVSPQPAVAQATRNGCGPLLGLSTLVEGQRFDKQWARDCVEFNRAVLAYLQKQPSIKTVVLSSPFIQYLDAKRFKVYRQDQAGNEEVFTPHGYEHAIDAFSGTIRAITQAGKRAMVVAPPPYNGMDSARCLERRGQALPVFGSREDCAIPLESYQRQRALTLEFLAEVQRRKIANVVWLDTLLCANGVCKTAIDGVALYRDPGHLSVEGARKLSVFIVQELGLESGSR